MGRHIPLAPIKESMATDSHPGFLIPVTFSTFTIAVYKFSSSQTSSSTIQKIHLSKDAYSQIMGILILPSYSCISLIVKIFGHGISPYILSSSSLSLLDLVGASFPGAALVFGGVFFVGETCCKGRGPFSICLRS
ncbi:hypothetical protein ABW19_dt0206642 [Dactylella cylindrospora]|nr:hypothetical protein ABW19_dt0206642 [Dactylella cylindrospora]